MIGAAVCVPLELEHGRRAPRTQDRWSGLDMGDDGGATSHFMGCGRDTTLTYAGTRISVHGTLFQTHSASMEVAIVVEERDFRTVSFSDVTVSATHVVSSPPSALHERQVPANTKLSQWAAQKCNLPTIHAPLRTRHVTTTAPPIPKPAPALAKSGVEVVTTTAGPSHKLSKGAIAGITISLSVIVIATVILSVLFLNRRRTEALVTAIPYDPTIRPSSVLDISVRTLPPTDTSNIGSAVPPGPQFGPPRPTHIRRLSASRLLLPTAIVPYSLSRFVPGMPTRWGDPSREVLQLSTIRAPARRQLAISSRPVGPTDEQDTNGIHGRRVDTPPPAYEA